MGTPCRRRNLYREVPAGERHRTYEGDSKRHRIHTHGTRADERRARGRNQANKKAPSRPRSQARCLKSPEQVSQRVRVDIPATPDLIGADTSSREQVIDMLPRTLEIRHRVGDGHQSRKFSLPHVHHLPSPPPRPTDATPPTPEAKRIRHGKGSRHDGSTGGFSEPVGWPDASCRHP